MLGKSDELIASLRARGRLWTPGAIFAPQLAWLTLGIDVAAEQDLFAHLAQVRGCRVIRADAAGGPCVRPAHVVDMSDRPSIVCAVVLTTTSLFIPVAVGHFALSRRQVEQAKLDARRHHRNLPQRQRRAKEELVRARPRTC